MDIAELINKLKNNRVFIQTHDMPDPDAIGSAFGLQCLLKHFEIDSVIVYVGRIHMVSAGRMLQTFGIRAYDAKDIKDMTPEDMIVLVDSQPKGSNVTPLTGQVAGCIDHHPDMTENYKGYKCIEDVGACATIIYNMFKKQGLEAKIDTRLATALSYSIRMDTSDFLRGTVKEDVEAFSELFEKTDRKILNSFYSNVLSVDDLKAYSAAIEDIRFYKGAGIAFIPFDAHDALVAAVSDFVLKLDSINVVIVYALRENGIRISLRSERDNADAGKMMKAALRGKGFGGGHKEMAGGFISFTGAINNVDSCKEIIDKCFLPILDQVDQRKTYIRTDIENRFNTW